MKVVPTSSGEPFQVVQNEKKKGVDLLQPPCKKNARERSFWNGMDFCVQVVSNRARATKNHLTRGRTQSKRKE